VGDPNIRPRLLNVGNASTRISRTASAADCDRVQLLQTLAHTMAGELELALAARQHALAAAQSSG
jgi:hypothetical protein